MTWLDPIAVPGEMVRGFDFVDYGTHVGNSLRLGYDLLGGERGLGTENHPANAAALRAGGIDFIEEDAARLVFPAGAFRFAILSHFLEHMNNRVAVEFVLASCARSCGDFIFIKEPYFDTDRYLAALGLKTVSYMYGQHTCHLDTDELVDSLLRVDIRNFTIWGLDPCWSSYDSEQIVPSNARQKWTARYNPDEMDIKEDITFDRPVFEEIVCVARLRDSSATARAIGNVERHFGDRLRRIIDYRMPTRVFGATPDPAAVLAPVF